MDAQLKISRGITRLLFSYPFWGALAIGTEFIEDNSIKTMCTNGRWIRWNRKFVDEMNEEECLGVIVHELMHIILKHMLRRGDRMPKKWNHATDYVINLIILKEGFKLPAGGLVDQKWDGMMAEKVYNELPDPPEMPSWGEVVDIGPEDAADVEVEVDQRIMNAANMAKSRGKLPAFIEGILKDMEDAQIDWKDKIRRFITGDQPDDYTFRRPERKAFYHLGLIAPSIDHKGAGDIVIGIDTSGSVSDKELTHFLAEINAISVEVNPRSITLIYCDMKIHNVETYGAGEEIVALNYKSRGGTLVMPVFKYIEDNNLPVDHMIYLTDLEVGDFPSRAPYPLLWVSTGAAGEKAPIGETVPIRIK